jgi:hypothetical protein
MEEVTAAELERSLALLKTWKETASSTSTAEAGNRGDIE